MRKNVVTSVVAVMLMVTGAGESWADARSYVWTYEYMTMPEGAAELEYYLTAKVPDTSERETSSWQHQVEIEYGVTPRWDLALYQVWQEDRTAESDDFDYDGFKLRTRYRVAEQDALPLDLLFYAEYKRASDLAAADVGEMKIILAKTIRHFNVSYNQVFEWPLDDIGEAEHKFAAGLGYEVCPTFHAGIEATGNYSEGGYAVGPTVSLRKNRYFLAVGVLCGLDDEAADLQSRLIFGLGL
jgi:hypothetical protein